MKIHAIQCLPYKNNSKSCYKHTQDVPISSDAQTSFKGAKGAIKGGAVGAAAALTVAALAGPFGIAVLPLWTTLGGMYGHTFDEDKKPNKPQDGDKTQH